MLGCFFKRYKAFIAIVYSFQNVLDKSNRRPNKIKQNNIKMYLMHNEGKRVIAERFIGTWKNKIYENMTAVSKND